MAEFDSIPRQPRKEFLITLAGPTVNFILAAFLWPFVRSIDADTSLYSFAGFVYQLFWANLVMGCFNLLPAFPMDGGRILRAGLATRMPYLRATRVAATVGKCVCITGVLVAVWHWQDLALMAILFTFIYFAGEAEYRAVRRREIEEARWREMMARFYAPSPPADEPPVLPR